MRRSTILLIIVLMIGLGCAYARPTPQYGKEYNEERKKVGLPIIPDDWELSRSLSGGSLWINPEAIEKLDKNIPLHRSKGLNYSTGSLISETDNYDGREDYTTIDGTFREGLSITYHYQIDENDYRKRLGWSAYLATQDREGEISLEEAEKILEEWGIKRLSYEFSPEE